MDEEVVGLVATSLPFDAKEDGLKPEEHIALRTQAGCMPPHALLAAACVASA